tara:strand:+ start:271169 stop:271519 length:351 start_codon:yes stop_codon:yes gene_type:complete
VLAALAMVVLFTATHAFTSFLDFATNTTFVVAPLRALLNYLGVTRCELPADARPRAAIKALSLTGIVVMGALAGMYRAGVSGGMQRLSIQNWSPTRPSAKTRRVGKESPFRQQRVP